MQDGAGSSGRAAHQRGASVAAGGRSAPWVWCRRGFRAEAEQVRAWDANVATLRMYDGNFVSAKTASTIIALAGNAGVQVRFLRLLPRQDEAQR